jgi:type III pantothenate kinase
MLNLVIDIGNTTTKLAIFNNREKIRHLQSSEISSEVIEEFIEGDVIDNSIVSSVGVERADLEAYLKSKTRFLQFSGLSKSAVNNRYQSPQTLGRDRYAAVIAAAALNPGDNCLVIDAGTCITYDFIDAERNYFGGSISPGLTMRYKALHHFTDRLPLVQHAADYHEGYGSDTRSAIITGVFRGMVNEILGFIDWYYKRYESLKILLCGGDVNFFDTELKSSIFAHALKTNADLVLIGLNEVIHYNND